MATEAKKKNVPVFWVEHMKGSSEGMVVVVWGEGVGLFRRL